MPTSATARHTLVPQPPRQLDLIGRQLKPSDAEGPNRVKSVSNKGLRPRFSYNPADTPTSQSRAGTGLTTPLLRANGAQFSQFDCSIQNTAQVPSRLGLRQAR